MIKLILKPPAATIFVLNALVFNVVVAAGILTHLVGIPEILAQGVGLLLTGAGVLISDLVYRRLNDLRLFDLSASAVIFFMPTWLAGLLVGLSGAGAVYGQYALTAAAPEFSDNSSVKSVSAASGQSWALLNDGRVASWGQGVDRGTLADDPSDWPTLVFRPNVFAGLEGIEQLAIGWGGDHGCAVKGSGEVLCWGSNEDGQLGVDAQKTPTRLEPAVVPGLEKVTQVATGARHSCAITQSKKTVCWGYDIRKFDWDDAPRTMAGQPYEVPGLSAVAALGAGWDFSCALREDGTVWCWGAYGEGRLGSKGPARGPHPSGRTATPVQVPGLSGVKSLSVGRDHSCVVLGNGTVKCWGKSGRGRLGQDSGRAYRIESESVPNLAEVKAVSAGVEHSCAVKTDERVVCWGKSTAFLPGESDDEESVGPTFIKGLTDVASVSAGEYHNCVVLTDQTVRCWGNNGSGELGVGSDLVRSRVVQPAGL